MASRAEGIAEIIINDQQAQNALKELADKAAKLNDRLHEMRKANDKLGYDKTKKELDAVNKEMKSYHKANLDVQRVLNNLSGSSYNELLKVQRQLRTEMRGMKRDTDAQKKAFLEKRDAVEKVDSELSKLQKNMKTTSTEGNKLGAMARKIGPYLAAAFSIGAIKSLVSNVIAVRQEFEKYEAVLTNTLGSKSEAQKSLKMIQDFASRTPFSVMELSESFVALANQGFKPTREEMIKLGDLASSTGRSFEQVAGALIAAQTGEYERLKAFGIVARVEGDKVKVTFKGVTKEIDRSAESMRAYLLELGGMAGVSGSMGAISETLGGKISNLGDAWDSLLNTLGKISGGIIGDVISGFSSLVGWTEKLISTPVSESLEKERIEVNTLLNSITSLNEGNEARARLLDELKLKYPEYLGNIDTEKTTNEEILRLQKDINDQFLKRIQLAVYEDELTEIFEKGKQAKKDEENAIKTINYEYEKHIKNKKEGISIEEKYNALLNEDLTNMGEYTSAGWDIWQAQETVRIVVEGSYNRIKESIKEQNKLMGESNAIIEKQNDLLTKNPFLNEINADKIGTKSIAELEEKIRLYDIALKSVEKDSEDFIRIQNKLFEANKLLKDFSKGNKPVHLNKYGQTFEEWKLEQELFRQQEQEYWDQLEEVVMPREESIDDEADYLASKYKETMEGRMTFLKAYHKAGLISEAEFNDEMTKLNKERNEKEIELEKIKQNAKAELVAATFDLAKTILKEGSTAYKIAASLETVINTYAAATAALAPPPVGLGPVAGIPLAAATVIRGLTNVARINAIQFAAGKYDVIGADDGRTYRAGMVQQSATGIYPEPTLIRGLGLVGERAPELVVDGPTLRNIQMNAPEIIEAINAMRVPQFATGNITQTSAISSPSNISTSALQDPRMDVMIALLQEVSTKLDKPTRATIVYQDLKYADDEINDIKNSVRK